MPRSSTPSIHPFISFIGDWCYFQPLICRRGVQSLPPQSLPPQVLDSGLGIQVEDEERLLLFCPNTQKVREHFCSALLLTHTCTLAKLMQTMNTITVLKFVACCQYQKTICPPWSTFRPMDSLVPNGLKIVNNKHIHLFCNNVFPCVVGKHSRRHFLVGTLTMATSDHC